MLATQHDLDAVYVISHGAAGTLQLGGGTLDSASLTRESGIIADWSRAFAPGGDLLLYGCDVAAGDSGIAFLTQLSRLTGADVAASVDLSGSAKSGGDWDLEYRTGPTESREVLTAAAQAAWDGVLATPLRALGHLHRKRGRQPRHHGTRFPARRRNCQVHDEQPNCGDPYMPAWWATSPRS